jgi:hypothetical protein
MKTNYLKKKVPFTIKDKTIYKVKTENNELMFLIEKNLIDHVIDLLNPVIYYQAFISFYRDPKDEFAFKWVNSKKILKTTEQIPLLS